LIGDRYTLLSTEQVAARIGPLTPSCDDDPGCWQAVAEQLEVARLLVLALHGHADADVATVYVVDRWGEVGHSQATLPRGGGFPPELVDWLMAHPPPAEPAAEPSGWWARLRQRRG